ncbi:MAG: pyridoxamine 5'-phosphate oxidase family protein [Acidobacteriota bacterium]
MKTKHFLIFVIVTILLSGTAFGEKDNFSVILKTAKEIIKSSEFTVLITNGLDGSPSARIMEFFPPDSNWNIFMGTNINSRKVKELSKDSKTSLYYESPEGNGYTLLKGEAIVITKGEYLKKFWKKGWEQYYGKERRNFAVIRFLTREIEVVSYKHGLVGDKTTWKAPSVSFSK